MDETSAIPKAIARPAPTYRSFHPRRCSYLPSYYEDDDHLDIYQAAQSSSPLSNPFNSVEDSIKSRGPKRKWFAISISTAVGIILVGIVAGLLEWHFRHRGKDGVTAPDGATPTSLSTPLRTGHGPATSTPLASATTTYASTSTITPAAFTRTLTVMFASTGTSSALFT